jgi:NADH-quinone oxidoreductase subunit J
MNILFYIASFFAIIATLKMIIGKNAIHALLYLIASLLSVSVIFFILGAPFIAALEVIIYAGAIMVLFVFVIMMLNLGKESVKEEHELFYKKIFIGPSIISLALLLEMIYILIHQASLPVAMKDIPPDAVGKLLFTKYILVVELAAFLLISGIIGAYHLGEKEKVVHHRFLQKENNL